MPDVTAIMISGEENRASSHETVLYVCMMISLRPDTRLLNSQRIPTTALEKKSVTEIMCMKRTWGYRRGLLNKSLIS